ncbi:MAG TPA: acylphosphatase [Flavisolibacter sp.]|nr:acylphosphatase [Flavisolibacter sp.]
MPTIHLLIKGKVQGVFYRASAKEKADQLHLTGWVKNTEDGHVEAVASGPQEAIDQFITWCKQGPKKAVVTDVQIKPLSEETFAQFLVIRG